MTNFLLQLEIAGINYTLYKLSKIYEVIFYVNSSIKITAYFNTSKDLLSIDVEK